MRYLLKIYEKSRQAFQDGLPVDYCTKAQAIGLWHTHYYLYRCSPTRHRKRQKSVRIEPHIDLTPAGTYQVQKIYFEGERLEYITYHVERQMGAVPKRTVNNPRKYRRKTFSSLEMARWWANLEINFLE